MSKAEQLHGEIVRAIYRLIQPEVEASGRRIARRGRHVGVYDVGDFTNEASRAALESLTEHVPRLVNTALKAADCRPRDVLRKHDLLTRGQRRLVNAHAERQRALEAGKAVPEADGRVDADEKVRELAQLCVVSLDAEPPGERGGSHASVLDRVADLAPLADEQLERKELWGAVSAALDVLPTRERKLIEATFIEGRLGAEVARELGVHGSRISQIRGDALARLRCALAEEE